MWTFFLLTYFRPLNKSMTIWAVVVAQLVDMSRFDSRHRQKIYLTFNVNFFEKTKINEKRGRELPIFRKTNQ